MTTDIEKKIQKDTPLAPLTTIQLGGPAKLFVECNNKKEIIDALTYANNKNIPVHILGSGSNTVFADKGFDGLVLKTTNKGIRFKKEKDKSYVSASAGETWDSLVEQCVNNGLAGFECLSGIPGSVGAAPVQNIGAYGQDVSQLITEVKVINRETTEQQSFSHDECQFGYRTSRFKTLDANKYIITNVVFKANNCESPNITYPDIIEQLGGEAKIASLDCSSASLKKIRDAVLHIRKLKAMVTDETNTNLKSCGSFFINPIITQSKLEQIQSKEDSVVPFFESNKQIKIPAAWLIARAGFPKGFRHGGVGISPQHNLAIVNYEGTTQEVMTLAQNIQQAVKQKFDIELVLETNAIPYTQ